MKLTKYFALLLCGGLVTACSEDYFNETSSTSLSSEQAEQAAKENPEQVLASQLKGCYTHWNHMAGVNSSDINGHMCRGMGGIMMLSDVMSNDVSLALGSGDPWRFDHALDYGAEQYNRPYWPWSLFYTIIKDANTVINIVDETGDMAAETKHLVGQAYAFRGISYAYLAQFYQRTYKNDYNNGGKLSTELPCVPIRLSSKEEGSVEGRATVEQVYAQVEKDLLKAIDYLDGYARTSKSEIDQQVAQGLLSRVYLVMNKWPEAAQMAHAARQGYAINDLQKAASWNYQDSSNGEVLWAYIPTSSTTMMYASWASWHSTDGPGYGGYAVGAFQLIDAALYNSIAASDVRKQLFVAPGEAIDLGSKGKIPDYANLKFDFVAQWLGNVVYMRASELMLTEIEAQFMSGNTGAAQSLLAEFMANRDPQWTAPAVLTQDYIYNQRRIELWGEGFGLFDCLRLHKALNRSYEGTNEPNSSQIDPKRYPNRIVPADDYGWIFQVPLSEINDNQSISEEDQNPLNGNVWTGK